MKTSYAFSRRGPDRLTEELAEVLSKGASFEFKALFSVVHANLKAKKVSNGGEEMLRLRAYEKLQSLVQGGIVLKTEKQYTANPVPLKAYQEAVAEQNAKVQSSLDSQRIGASSSRSRVPVLGSRRAKLGTL